MGLIFEIIFLDYVLLTYVDLSIMYRASKQEFSTCYLFEKQGTSEGSEWFHIAPKSALVTPFVI